MDVIQLFRSIYNTTTAPLDVVSFSNQLYLPELLAVEGDDIYLVGLGTVNGKYALAQPKLKLVEPHSFRVTYTDIHPLNLSGLTELKDEQIISITNTARSIERERRGTFKVCSRCVRLRQSETIRSVAGDPVCLGCRVAAFDPSSLL